LSSNAGPRNGRDSSSCSQDYGYFWWLSRGGVFEACGIMGQTISINPGEDLICVQHTAWADSGQDEDYRHEAALKAAVTAALKGQ
jgi:hypothetical protein